MVRVLPPSRPVIPEPPEGQVWHIASSDIAPAGHALWLNDPEYYDEMGRDPLQRAGIWLISDSESRLEKLDKVLDEYPKASHRRKLLFRAVLRGDEAMTRRIVQTGLKVQPHIPDTGEDKETDNEEAEHITEDRTEGPLVDEDDPTCVPMHAATFHGHLNCVKILIEEGNVDVNSPDETGRTSLIAAADKPETLAYLLDRGAAISRRIASDNMFGHHAANALEFAAAYALQGAGSAPTGGFEALKLLLDKGGFPLEDRNGISKREPLTTEQRERIENAMPDAVAAGELSSIFLLMSYLYPSIENGTPVNFKVPDDLHKRFVYGAYGAMKSNSPDKSEYIQGLGIREHDAMSLDKLPEGQNLNLQRLLEDGAVAGSLNCVKLLIRKYHAKPDGHRLPPGIQPLYKDASRNQTETIRYLLENHHRNIYFGNGRYASGPTAFWSAIHLKAFGCISLLLKHGGPVDHIDGELVQIKEPCRALLRAISPSLGSGPKYLDRAHSNWRNMNPGYVWLDLSPEDNEWLGALQLRKTIPAAKNDRAVTDGLDGETARAMAPMLTYADIEAKLKNDEDVMPEFKPYASVPQPTIHF
ncbi:ankyrin repeat-containing domain protein [Xylariaceae sp. FL1272]|nr:ankyrin repeat-containing domain protein [Xylariaceae sp. FL1272]